MQLLETTFYASGQILFSDALFTVLVVCCKTCNKCSFI